MYINTIKSSDEKKKFDQIKMNGMNKTGGKYSTKYEPQSIANTRSMPE